MRNGNADKEIQTPFDVGCSYPTYEEWKLKKVTVNNQIQLVLILPMRNGNHKTLDKVHII